MSFFSCISSYFLLTLVAFVIGCCITIATLGTIEWHRMKISETSAESSSIVEALRPEVYQETLVITSISTSTKKIIAQVRSTTAGQFIPTIFQYGDDTEIIRRDVIVENGVIVGLTEQTSKTIEDLLPGSNGIGTIVISKDGAIHLRRIVIGDPLPRP